jgi:hypothetical protein
MVCITALITIWRLETCNSKDSSTVTVVTPKDTNYAPVTHKDFQPSSLPFLKKKSSGVKLPAGISEKDVEKIISVAVKDVPKDSCKRIDIIQTKDGEVFVHKDSSVESVIVTRFIPPLMDWDLRLGYGLTAALAPSSSKLTASPALIVAPLCWSGWLDAPMFLADLDGIGLGAQARLYHDIFVGAAGVWRYDTRAQAKITLSYTLHNH